jgi:hypothetical protein
VEPIIVQGGMGVGASSWQLARAVANLGQLGVVSGTAVAVTVARRLSDGDPGGHVRRALDAFPVPDIAARVRDRYLREEPRSTGARFPGVARPVLEPARKDLELLVVANFVEVTLAKQGTDGQIGVNYLEKIQLPTLPSLYGAVLAGADAVLMGAGIPAHIPAILDRLARHEDVELRIDVAGGDKAISRFSPAAFLDGHPAPSGVASPLLRHRLLAHAGHLPGPQQLRQPGRLRGGAPGRRGAQRPAPRPTRARRDWAARLRLPRHGQARGDRGTRQAVLARRRLRHPPARGAGAGGRCGRGAGRNGLRVLRGVGVDARS